VGSLCRGEAAPYPTQKAAAVVWCHVSERRDVEITLAGWNTLGDVEAAPELWTGPEGKQVHNYQLAVKQVRPISELPGFVGA